MSDPVADEPPYQRNETEAQRLDRNYSEMLQELRVILAGVQILFAFLLTLAFQSRFSSVTDFQRNVYVVALVAAALTAGILIAPTAFHRLVFRRGMKDELMRAATRYAGAGLVTLFVAMNGAVLLVLDFLLAAWLAVLITVCLALLFVAMWLVLPLWRRAQHPRG